MKTTNEQAQYITLSEYQQLVSASNKRMVEGVIKMLEGLVDYYGEGDSIRVWIIKSFIIGVRAGIKGE